MVSLQVTAVDHPESQRLLTDYFTLRAETFPDKKYVTVFPAREIFTEPAGVFVLLRDDDDKPVGCGGIRAVSPGPHGARFEVKHLYLAPGTRGRGWGRLLMNDLEARARELGADELVLDTHHTLTAAGSLYATTGFTEIEPYNTNPNATRWYGKVLT